MSSTRTTRALVAAGAALAIGASVTATASAEAGSVLEFGRTQAISGSTGNDGSTFTKAFVTDKRSRVLVTDGGTSALIQEYTTSPRIWKDFNAAENTLTLRDGVSEPFVQTPAQEAAYFQQGVAKGCFVKTGSSSGMDHYKMVDEPQLPCSDNPDTKVTADVDQKHGYVITRVTTVGTFKQVDSLAYTKVHDEPGSKALLAMDKHPGATIVDERS